MLGYTRATLSKTKGSNIVKLSESSKILKFRSVFESQLREDEIVSNRKSLCYGEDKPNSAHTAHHAREGGVVQRVSGIF